MKSVFIVMLFFGFYTTISAQDGRYDEIGHVALATNILMPITKGIPISLDVRTKSIIHGFRYAKFWGQSGTNFYDVLTPLVESPSFKTKKGSELSYAMKFIVKAVDETPFLVYVGPQYVRSDYEFYDIAVKYEEVKTKNNFNETLSGKININRYMLNIGIMLFPKKRMFLDSYLSVGFRNFKMTPNETIPISKETITAESCDFFQPEGFEEVFFQKQLCLSFQAGFRFGLSF